MHAALDSGITLLDTGDCYDCGHNEMLTGKALTDLRSQALLSVKFRALRSPQEESAVPAAAIAGTRYATGQMEMLDSEN